ncbi:MAG TPA: glutamate-1-semialdehyde 2,1-aminomutase [Candidatus Acidoferrum sp.]|jgi:glutamate-1-semialdehyde 2,1-aminomutase
MKFDKSKELQPKAHALIPGGAHVYAKGDDQYPVNAPGFIVRGNGCHVWDSDGNEFIEYGMGLRSVSLGHGYPSVVEAAHRQMLCGSNFSRPSPVEAECAEILASFIPSAEMVKFSKNGSDVTTAAVKLARAYTGRDMVAVCADQPFFSVDDWFIGSTPFSAGIPKAIRDLTVKFRYNDLESLRQLFLQFPGRIACVILEAETALAPALGFLEGLQDLVRANGAVFILDEMITGFRWHLGGAQSYYGLHPDLSTFGKAMANGFSVAALAGRRELMELGGLHHDKERVFLLSTTHGSETHGLAAAIETMRVYRSEGVIEHLYRQGERLRKEINGVSKSLGLDEHFKVLGKAPNLVYATLDESKKNSQSFRALFLQETLQQGLLMPSLVVSFSHSDEDIDRTIDGIGKALRVYRNALEQRVEKYLVGRPLKPVFRKFN